jgi:hypothetical protein
MTSRGPKLEPPLPPRRTFRLWTIAAPAALLVLVVVLFNAVSSSCALRDCPDAAPAKDVAAADSTPKPRFHRVKEADSMGGIAERYGLTIDEIKACNPNVDPNALQVRQRLRVEKEFCKKAYENAPI